LDDWSCNKEEELNDVEFAGNNDDLWRSPHLEIWSKYLLFHAIPMNLLLWGCETWLMRKALSNKLEVFLHHSIQQILQVSVTKMKEEQIRNDHIRQMFYNIPRVCNMIAARQFDFIGKVARTSRLPSPTDADGVL
jgi:hypothetical protein